MHTLNRRVSDRPTATRATSRAPLPSSICTAATDLLVTFNLTAQSAGPANDKVDTTANTRQPFTTRGTVRLLGFAFVSFRGSMSPILGMNGALVAV